MKTTPYIYVLLFFSQMAFAQAEHIPPPPPIVEEPKRHEGGCLIGITEQKPEFPGGEKALMQYLGDNLKFPPNCFSVVKESSDAFSTDPKAFIGLTIEKDGCVENVKILRGSAYPLFDELALNLVRGMPQWKPAMQNGKAVCVQYTLPVRVRLD